MAIRFGLRSALAIVTSYGVLLAAMRPLGTIGIVVAVVAGTSLSGVIILAGRKNLGEIARMACGTIIGTMLGSGCLSQVILAVSYAYDNGSKSAVLGGIVGAVCGAMIASSITQSRKPADT